MNSEDIVNNNEENIKAKSSFWNKFKEPETKAILTMLGFALIARIVISLMFNTGHPTDITNFKIWSADVVRKGMHDFFLPTKEGGTWCDYPPGYIYILYLMGYLYKLIFDPQMQNWLNSSVFTTFIKFPGIVADILNAYLIFSLSRRFIPSSLAIGAATLYAFQPFAFFESAIWGQMDSVSTLFLLLSVIFSIDKKFALAIFITAVNCMMKPQGILLIPFIGFLILYNKAFKQLLIGLLTSFSLVFMLSYPITLSIVDAIPWIWSHYQDQAALYPFSSIQAFNLWSLTGLWKEDSRTILGLTHKLWGLIIFLGYYFSCIAYFVVRSKNNYTNEESKSHAEAVSIIFAATLILLGFFLLPTRMHERYLFPGLSFLAITAAINYKVKNLYTFLSFSFLINLFYEFPGDKTTVGAPEFMRTFTLFLGNGNMYTENFGFFWFTPIAILNIYVIAMITLKLWKENLVEISEEDIKEIELKSEDTNTETIIKQKGFSLPPIQKIDLNDWALIGLIAFASTLIRLFYLSYPEEMVFDEVYHARAAGEYLRGIHPFEWVHPPLAKLLLAVGAWGFGLNSFGWRIMPVIFGTLFVPVMYIFGKSMFSKRWLGVVAAIVISLDGVFFVQSRTAMTNIFATFFQITAVLFFWLYVQHDFYEKRVKAYIYFALSGLFISLALSTRWTSMGALAFIIGSIIWYKFLFDMTIKDLLTGNFKPIVNRISKEYIYFATMALIFFVGLPILVYLISYIPYMNLNHTVKEVWDMQKGIYTYHKNLRDPHPYYSEWYTWPFLIRPTWYYFRDFRDGTMAGIIAIGNPAIWWSSVFVTMFSIYMAIKEKKAHLLYIGLGFVILYLPWAVSPRIKNFNHYLFEAIPYACLSITFLIGYLWDRGNVKKELTKEDKTFNILSISAVVLLSLALAGIAFISVWTNVWNKPFPIEALLPYRERMFNAVPYMIISLVSVITYALYENSKFRAISMLYFGSIIGLFIFFYPLFAGYPMSWWYYGIHIWMKSWI